MLRAITALISARSSYELKSITDDDLCADCGGCDYRPGDLSACELTWSGLEDQDASVQECALYEFNTHQRKRHRHCLDTWPLIVARGRASA